MCHRFIFLLFLFDFKPLSLADNEFSSTLTYNFRQPLNTTLNYQEFPQLEDAIKNIAHFLRSHKFNEFDRRYNSPEVEIRYFREFPRPALRSLHWEVHKYCESSLFSCIKYLSRKIRNVAFKRSDDTTLVIIEQNWLDNSSYLPRIINVDEECQSAFKLDNTLADPFEGPIERFQWRTTASYYMCWYTMKEEPILKKLHESCDNFANCLDPHFGVHNHDPRANDTFPFHCALYSFCPDPCCPQKHIGDGKDCWDVKENPCFEENGIGKRQCHLNRTQNTNLIGLILNQWNVTCNCTRKGTVWDSSFGICVDIDECAEGTDNCLPEEEFCINRPYSFACACRWAYVRNESSSCVYVKELNLNEPEQVVDKSGKNGWKKLFGGCKTNLLPFEFLSIFFVSSLIHLFS